MKRRKQAKKDLVVMVTAFVAMIMIGIGSVNIAETIKNNEVINNSPLNNYTLYYSLDNFPKYKLEAAEKVEELMSAGTSEQEACQVVIDEVSDKIYEDTLEFYSTRENGWETEVEDIEAQMLKFMAKKQR